METPAEKISIAKSRLIMSEPFFASLVMPMEFVEDYSCKAMCTNGKQIRYNPSFVDQRTIEEVVGVLAHEGLHVGMCHHTRGENKDHKTWNQACDYAINPILKESFFKLPQGGLFKDEFKDKYAEDIYEIIYEEPQDNQGGGGNGDGSSGQQQQPGQQSQQGQGNQQQNPDEFGPEDWGGVEQNDFNETGETNEEAEANAKQRMVQAMNAAKQAGKLSAGLERLVEDLIETKTPWAEILSRFVAEVSTNDYSWLRPNKRYIPSGLYLPELRSEEFGKIVFAIDTSSSIDKETLKVFVSELKEASSLFKIPCLVVHCDSRVKHVEELEEDSDIIPVGGGGTKFSPVFEYVEENDIECKALVYLSDGYCGDFPDEPEYNTLWCIYGTNNKFNPPFGEVIKID